MIIKDIINTFSNKRLNTKDEFDVSAQDISNYKLIHEIIHCDEKQRNMTPMEAETDSDYHAIKTIIKNKDAKAKEYFIKFFFNLRAIDPSRDIHDVTLMLDSKLNNTPPIRKDFIQSANDDVYLFLNHNYRPNEKYTHPLTKKRLKFYRKAKTFFTKPAIVKKTNA